MAIATPAAVVMDDAVGVDAVDDHLHSMYPFLPEAGSSKGCLHPGMVHYSIMMHPPWHLYDEAYAVAATMPMMAWIEFLETPVTMAVVMVSPSACHGLIS